MFLEQGICLLRHCAQGLLMSSPEHLRFAKRHCLHALQPAISYLWVFVGSLLFPDNDRFAKMLGTQNSVQPHVTRLEARTTSVELKCGVHIISHLKYY